MIGTALFSAITDSSQAFDVLGLVGAALIVGAYALLQAEKIDSKSVTYSLVNGIGALAILVSLTVDFNMGAFVVEAFWLLVSVYGLFRARRR